MLDGFNTRAAWALCTLAYSAGPGTEPILFEGRTDGRIVPPRGSPKFGWGPVFEADDNGLTYVSGLSCPILRVLRSFSGAGTDGDENAYFAATRRWRRHRNMRFLTGHVRCRSCARTCKRRGEGEAAHNHIGSLVGSLWLPTVNLKWPDASHNIK